MPATRPSRHVPSVGVWVAGAVALACTVGQDDGTVPACDPECLSASVEHTTVERETAFESRWSCGCGWCAYRRDQGGTADDCAGYDDVREEWFFADYSTDVRRVCVYCAGRECRPLGVVTCDGEPLQLAAEYVCSDDLDLLTRLCGPPPQPTGRP